VRCLGGGSKDGFWPGVAISVIDMCEYPVAALQVQAELQFFTLANRELMKTQAI